METHTNTRENQKNENMSRLIVKTYGSDQNDENDLVPISSTPVPEPVKGYYETRVPNFIKKVLEIVKDPETDDIVSWSFHKDSFVIWKKHEFCADILPKYFRHDNFSSFARQLSKYVNRDKETCEYAHEAFQGGKEHLLETIKPRGGSNPMFEPKQSNLEDNLVKLKNDLNSIEDTIMKNNSKPGLNTHISSLEVKLEVLKNEMKTIKLEVIKLKQQQEGINCNLAAIKRRTESNEYKLQYQIRALLEKTFSNRTFFGQLIKLMREKRQLSNGQIAKKPRLNDPLSSKNLVISSQVEHKNDQNEDENITTEKHKEKLVSDLAEEKGGPTEEQKADEATEWGNPTMWEMMMENVLIRENEARARTEMERYHSQFEAKPIIFGQRDALTCGGSGWC